MYLLRLERLLYSCYVVVAGIPRMTIIYLAKATS